MKKEIKGFICGVVATSIIGCMSISATGVWDKIDVLRNDINVMVNGTPVTADNFLYNDTTYLPMRAVAEALGEDVQYDEKTNTAYIGERTEMNTENTTDPRTLRTEVINGHTVSLLEFDKEYATLLNPPLPKEINGYYELILVDGEDYIDYHSIVTYFRGKLRNLDIVDNTNDAIAPTLQFKYTLDNGKEILIDAFLFNDRTYLNYKDFMEQVYPYIQK